MMFAWFDADETPHVIEDCDGFEELEAEAEERPAERHGKRPERWPIQDATAHSNQDTDTVHKNTEK